MLMVCPVVPAAGTMALAAGTFRVGNYLRTMNSGLDETLL